MFSSILWLPFLHKSSERTHDGVVGVGIEDACLEGVRIQTFDML